MDILNVVTKIELKELGVEKKISVYLKEDFEYFGGASVLKGEIYLNNEFVNKEDAYTLVFVTIHEVFHIYQYEVELSLMDVPEKYQALEYYSEAIRYRDENTDGLDLNIYEDYVEYKKSHSEVTANDFAKRKSLKYVSFINDKPIES